MAEKRSFQQPKEKSKGDFAMGKYLVRKSFLGFSLNWDSGMGGTSDCADAGPEIRRTCQAWLALTAALIEDTCEVTMKKTAAAGFTRFTKIMGKGAMKKIAVADGTGFIAAADKGAVKKATVADFACLGDPACMIDVSWAGQYESDAYQYCTAGQGICEGLHYSCEWEDFQNFADTPRLAYSGANTGGKEPDRIDTPTTPTLCVQIPSNTSTLPFSRFGSAAHLYDSSLRPRRAVLAKMNCRYSVGAAIGACPLPEELEPGPASRRFPQRRRKSWIEKLTSPPSLWRIPQAA
jgi:hypothetical protein